MQSAPVPPEHVPQLESHGWQLSLLSTKRPSGHVARQALSCSMGTSESAAHDVQLPAASEQE